MIRTLTFALCYDRTNSRAIGYYATQQNAAYNHGVDVLNREPELPQRSGRNHPDAINKRITAWRQDNQKGADDPYHIHREGGEQAWEVNQRLQQSRAERLERIAQADDKGEEPKHRDVRPHRRTLAHRSRKDCRLSLTITDKRLFQVSDDGQTLTSRQWVHCPPTGAPDPQMAGHPLHTARSRGELRATNTASPPTLLPPRSSGGSRAYAHRPAGHRKP